MLVCQVRAEKTRAISNSDNVDLRLEQTLMYEIVSNRDTAGNAAPNPAPVSFKTAVAVSGSNSGGNYKTLKGMNVSAMRMLKKTTPK